MNAFLKLMLGATLAAVVTPATGALSVFATVPEWGALLQALGGDRVQVYVATTATQDPHRIEAKPSLIARARTADLVVSTGADLETGWLSLVTQQAGNPKIRPGQPGYFEATSYVALLERPTRLDRADGDVHAAGNPHIHTDPRNIALVANALASRLAQIDPGNAEAYRAQHKAFDERWRAAIARWEREAAPLKGTPILVQHKSFTYLIAWLGMKEVAALEPKPGVDPTVGYLSEVLSIVQRQPVKMVVRAAYQSERASQWIAERAKIPAVVLPFTVGGDSEAKDLFTLFDDTIARLLKPLA
jgi:zinc/manganese transport system substrate-binding protein